MKSTLCRAYLNVFDATLDSTFALGLTDIVNSVDKTKLSQLRLSDKSFERKDKTER